MLQTCVVSEDKTTILASVVLEKGWAVQVLVTANHPIPKLERVVQDMATLNLMDLMHEDVRANSKIVGKS